MTEPTPRVSLWREYLHFLRHEKKWWITPIVLALLLLGALLAGSSSALAPFLYPLL